MKKFNARKEMKFQEKIFGGLTANNICKLSDIDIKLKRNKRKIKFNIQLILYCIIMFIRSFTFFHSLSYVDIAD